MENILLVFLASPLEPFSPLSNYLSQVLRAGLALPGPRVCAKPGCEPQPQWLVPVWSHDPLLMELLGKYVFCGMKSGVGWTASSHSNIMWKNSEWWLVMWKGKRVAKGWKTEGVKERGLENSSRMQPYLKPLTFRKSQLHGQDIPFSPNLVWIVLSATAS